MKLLDPDHPFFAKPWRRWLTILLPLAWAGVELYGGNTGWAMLFGAAAAYAFYMLIVKRPQS